MGFGCQELLYREQVKRMNGWMDNPTNTEPFLIFSHANSEQKIYVLNLIVLFDIRFVSS